MAQVQAASLGGHRKAAQGDAARVRPADTADRERVGWRFFVVLMAIKPVIDLMWDLRLPLDLNPPRLVAIALVPILLILLLTGRNLRGARTPARYVIIFFMMMQIVLMVAAVLLGNANIIYGVNILIRGLDAFLIYLVFGRYWTSRERVYVIFRVLLYSMLAVNILSVATYFTGSFNLSVTGGVERFAGLYNDAGGPSYNGVFALVFATVALEMTRQMRPARSYRTMQIIWLITLGSSLLLVTVSITKSAILMLGIFVVMWWGIHKGRVVIIFPALLALSIYLIQGSEVLQQRFENETRVFIEGDFTAEALSAIGTGRFTTWTEVWSEFRSLPIALKFLGTGRSFGAHNQFLAYLMLFGVVGMTAFTIVLGRLWVSIGHRYRADRLPELMGARAMLAIFVANAMIGHPFLWTTSLWHLMILLSLMSIPARTTRLWKIEASARRRRVS